jgi:hypothetical protein
MNAESILLGLEAFVMDLIAAAARGYGSSTIADVAKTVAPTNDTWKLYDAYIDAVTKECTKEMLPKWVGTLGGTEAVMPSQCWTMTSAIDIERAARALSQAQAQQLEASAPNSSGDRR